MQKDDGVLSKVEPMNLDEALTEAMQGGRVTAPHLQSGCYVEHSFARGYLRCWSVDTPDDEPNRTQCDFIADDADRTAVWRLLSRDEQYPPKPKLIGGWASFPQPARVTAEMGRNRVGKTASPPVADVIDLTAVTPVDTGKPLADLRAWEPPLDRMKDGW